MNHQLVGAATGSSFEEEALRFFDLGRFGARVEAAEGGNE
jgi:hypothetical protein